MKHSILSGLTVLALSSLAVPVAAIEPPTDVVQQISNNQANSDYERLRIELLEDLDSMFEQRRQEMMADMDAQLGQMHEEMVRMVNERFRQAAQQRINR